MRTSGITKRWGINTLGVIAVLLMLTVIVASVAIHTYYYETVRTTLESRPSDTVSSFFNAYIGTTQERFSTGARSFVESFDQKEIMEVWVIDQKGNIIISSGGFSIPDGTDMQDYSTARNSVTGVAMWTGKLPSGEKVMARTIMMPAVNGVSAGAVRYIISLDQTDRQIYTNIALLVLICLFALFLVAFSGFYFIQSIVKPVHKINETARQIARGDFSARIDSHHFDDEIGELCETINYMAGEISEADRVKNDFISTISHELRTPLTAIKGWGETLLQVGDSDPAMMNKGMQVIISESGRLSGIVEELLDFSRMQSGRMNLRVEKIDVLAELDEAVFVFKERALREGVEMVYNVPTVPAPMDGDANRIKQVFVNILDNALKYTEQGGRVIIFAQIKEKTIEIVMRDNGCGIPPADLPHVKEKFYKANVSVRGSGIGLAVTDEIIKLHHGQLNISSEMGEGTTVEIILPIEPVVLEPLENPAERNESNE